MSDCILLHPQALVLTSYQSSHETFPARRRTTFLWHCGECNHEATQITIDSDSLEVTRQLEGNNIEGFIRQLHALNIQSDLPNEIIEKVVGTETQITWQRPDGTTIPLRIKATTETKDEIEDVGHTPYREWNAMQMGLEGLPSDLTIPIGKNVNPTIRSEIQPCTHIKIHRPNWQLVYEYDTAGDMIYRWYCPVCHTDSRLGLPTSVIKNTKAIPNPRKNVRLAEAQLKKALQTQATRQHKEQQNMLYNQIKSHLDTQFIHTEKIARLLSLAIKGEKNCILWGAAGHAKSEMVAAAIEALDLTEKAFIQSFGEGMDEARLYGGLNFAKLEAEGILEYNADRSFLAHEVAVFEEIFDAPPIVLLTLKDTLTARELRNGAQRFPMATTSIIAITNRAPSEISEIGAAAHALVERFPLQLEVKWDAYTAENYRAMFNKVKPKAPQHIKHSLANLIQDADKEGCFISPRTAIHALETVLLMNHSHDDNECFEALRFVPGFEKVVENIAEKIERERVLQKAMQDIEACENNLLQMQQMIESTTDPMALLGFVKRVEPFIEELETLKLPDNLVEMRNNLKNVAQQLMNHAANKAVQLTPGDPHVQQNALPAELPVSES